MWPRDNFVYHMNKYVKGVRGLAPASLTTNPFGEGGKILTGDDYLLITNFAYGQNGIQLNIEKPTSYQKKEILIEAGKKHFPNSRIHVLPSSDQLGSSNSHIDMYASLIPSKKLLLVDTRFGSQSNYNDFEEIAEKESLKFIKFDGSQDKVWNSLNILVLEDTVVLDNKSISLIKLLEDEGVKTIGVEMPQHSYPSGKIRCQTNVYSENSDILLDELLGLNYF